MDTHAELGKSHEIDIEQDPIEEGNSVKSEALAAIPSRRGGRRRKDTGTSATEQAQVPSRPGGRQRKDAGTGAAAKQAQVFVATKVELGSGPVTRARARTATTRSTEPIGSESDSKKKKAAETGTVKVELRSSERVTPSRRGGRRQKDTGTSAAEQTQVPSRPGGRQRKVAGTGAAKQAQVPSRPGSHRRKETGAGATKAKVPSRPGGRRRKDAGAGATQQVQVFVATKEELTSGRVTKARVKAARSTEPIGSDPKKKKGTATARAKLRSSFVALVPAPINEYHHEKKIDGWAYYGTKPEFDLADSDVRNQFNHQLKQKISQFITVTVGAPNGDSSPNVLVLTVSKVEVRRKRLVHSPVGSITISTEKENWNYYSFKIVDKDLAKAMMFTVDSLARATEIVCGTPLIPCKFRECNAPKNEIEELDFLTQNDGGLSLRLEGMEIEAD